MSEMSKVTIRCEGEFSQQVFELFSGGAAGAKKLHMIYKAHPSTIEFETATPEQVDEIGFLQRIGATVEVSALS